MDTLAIVSLICLIAAIALGFFFKVNIGIIAVGAALVLGKLSGIEDGTILKYFNSTLFMRLLGVLLLFSIAQANGTIEKLTRRAVYSMRKIPRLIPILIFIISALLGGVAGSIPILALMATITAALARQMNVHPIKLAPFEVFGAIAGAVTPVSMSGVLIESLAVDAGLPFSYLPSYLTSVLCNFVPCLACFFLFRWHTHKSIPGFEGMKPEKLDRHQLITLFGIILMIAMTVFFGIDVGLASIFCSVLLLFLRVSDEKASLNGVPWGTLVMISGMGILISMVDDLHGIDLIANFLEGFLTPALAPVVYVLLSGVMSLVSSAQGVVMPTLIPTIPAIVAAFPSVSPEVMVMAILTGSACTTISPFSTGGALVLGAYSSICDPTPKERDKMFLYLIFVALIWLVALAVLSGFGFLHIFF